ncbi:MAG: cardiolipin synthase, partial [Planctomycetes bacterium]|nr:cardiolipin synthase [Planctomycetota bacterium]
LLKKAGVKIVTVLDVGVVRAVFERLDLRNHRKIVVIDGEIGYAGSQNLADPRLFKQDEDVGEWVDAMARMTGPAVEALQLTLLGDWEFETFEGVEHMGEQLDLRRNRPTGDAVVQVVPSGPGLPQSAIQELILTAIYGAQRELVLTTPYFIPDDAMMKALVSASGRGVDVTLVVPFKPDGHLVKLASQAYFEELLEQGIKIAQYRGGLLHTKAITVDGEVAMFGSVNLDMRSFYLNFEVSLLVYSGAFTGDVRALQDRYLKSSRLLTLEGWRARPMLLKLLQQLAQLLSPLL